MEALDRLRDYRLNSTTEGKLEYVLDEYRCFLEMLEKLTPTRRDAVLRVLANNELENNQEMEHEDKFLVQLGLELPGEHKKTSIEVMTDSILKNEPFNINKIKQLHRLIIRGTNDDVPRNYGIRDFDTYVCEVVNGVEKVSYTPPSPEEIRPYLRDLFDFLNETDNDEKNIFTNSILSHFYIAALQPFGNGNTRLARLIEYGSIFKLSRDILGSKIKSPALYASGRYLVYRKQYRDSIANLVACPTDEQYNKWVDYNLNMLDEQLNYSSSRLEEKIKRGF